MLQHCSFRDRLALARRERSLRPYLTFSSSMTGLGGWVLRKQRRRRNQGPGYGGVWSLSPRHVNPCRNPFPSGGVVPGLFRGPCFFNQVNVYIDEIDFHVGLGH